MEKNTRSESDKRAIEAINRSLDEILGVTSNGRQRSDFIYFEAPDQRRFCYTPWKDFNGYYFTWIMKPYGRGAKSGKAKRWKRVGKIVSARKRKTAKARAYKRYLNWLKYLRGEK